MVRTIFSRVFSVIFPSRCLHCGQKDTPLCNLCLSKCARAIDTPALYITSYYSFRDPLIRRAIHAIKYYHRSDLVFPLVCAFVQELKDTISCKLSTESWVLIPIPMPRLRRYIRGYNQAELIAEHFARGLSIPLCLDILIRVTSKKRQVATKTRSEREKNIHGAFAISQNVKGMNIILVDDVTTTGATLEEFRRILLRAGAQDVRAITIAH